MIFHFITDQWGFCLTDFRSEEDHAYTEKEKRREDKRNNERKKRTKKDITFHDEKNVTVMFEAVVAALFTRHYLVQIHLLRHEILMVIYNPV